MPFTLPYWSPSQTNAILFDWDGVIVETRLNFSGLREKYYGGRRAMLLEDAGSLSAEKKASLMLDIEDIEIRGAMNAEIVPGVLDVIEWSEKNGIPWAVVSRNCKKSIELAAAAASVKLPEVVRSRDDGDCVKPDPRALAETCRALGADPAQTLFIGDYIYDMIGARRTGMRGVLIREKIESDWAQWLECSYSSMLEFHRELASSCEFIPWEYQDVASKYGRKFMRAAAEITAFLHTVPARPVAQWLLTAASLGVGAFAVQDASFSPNAWKKNPSFDPACMGTSFPDAVRSFLRVRFPLATVTAAEEKAGNHVMLPDNPCDIEGFLLSLVK
jgi:HAD superfamily hydrolase (TIGR01509 family)